jgi:flagellar motor switch/type III secretory pathway protein FliN
MQELDKAEGELELVLGSGWVSLYELGALAPGAIILSTRLAGTGYELRFEGERLAEATAVILGEGESHFLCAQIRSLERQGLVQPEPFRGIELTELLPFTIVLGSAKASLESLAGLGRMSVIDLGIEATGRQLATLMVAGIEAAKGVVCVAGESMGLRVTEVLAAPSSSPPFRTAGRSLDPRHRFWKAKDYDFARPDCFTLPQIEALAGIHQDFLRAFASLCGGLPENARLHMVDQLNFSEFAASLSEGELIVAAPCTTRQRPRFEESERPSKELLRLSGRRGFPEAFAREWVRGELAKPVGGAILATGKILESRREELFVALRDAWKSYGALAPFPAVEMRRARVRPALALGAYASEFEMVALASFDLGSGGWLNIAYPQRAIELVLKALSE